jgi:hypothetical protein
VRARHFKPLTLLGFETVGDVLEHTRVAGGGLVSSCCSIHLPTTCNTETSASSSPPFYIIYLLTPIRLTNVNLVLLKSLSLLAEQGAAICSVPSGYAIFHTEVQR